MCDLSINLVRKLKQDNMSFMQEVVFFLCNIMTKEEDARSQVSRHIKEIASPSGCKTSIDFCNENKNSLLNACLGVLDFTLKDSCFVISIDKKLRIGKYAMIHKFPYYPVGTTFCVRKFDIRRVSNPGNEPGFSNKFYARENENLLRVDIDTGAMLGTIISTDFKVISNKDTILCIGKLSNTNKYYELEG